MNKINVLPKRWCVEVTESNYDVLREYCLKLSVRKDFKERFGNCTYPFWLLSDSYDGSYQSWSSQSPNEYTEITIEQFKEHILMEDKSDSSNKRIVKYKLIKEYPGSFSLGWYASESDAESECSRFPEFWAPVYEEEQFTVVLSGHKSKICKDGVAFGCTGITIDELKAVKTVFELNSKVSDQFHLIHSMNIGVVTIGMINKILEATKVSDLALKDTVTELPF